MEAIVRKNDQAQASVKKASIYMSLIGSFIIIVLFSFSVNFPGFIANPLLELTGGNTGNQQEKLSCQDGF
jgi:NtrC-family two-component system sensor histidine kinase KinB